MFDINIMNNAAYFELLGFSMVILALIWAEITYLNRKQKYVSRLFVYVDVAFIVMFIADNMTMTGLLYFNKYVYLINLFIIIKCIAFSIASFTWFMYYEREIGGNVFQNKKIAWIVAIPFLVSIGLVLFSFVNGNVFVVENSTVKYGTLYFISLHMSYLYFILVIIVAFVRALVLKDKEKKIKNALMCIYTIPIITTLLIEIIIEKPFACVGITVSMILVVVNVIIAQNVRARNKQLEIKQRRDALVTSLTEDFVAVYIVDVDSNTVKTVRLLEKRVKEREEESRITAYDERMDKDLPVFVYEEDYSVVRERFEINNVWQNLSDNEPYEVSFRAKNGDGEILYYRAKFTKLNDESAKRFVLGFKNVDAETRQSMEMERLKEEEAVNKKTKELQNVVQAMTSEYDLLFGSDLKTGSVKIYRASEQFQNIFDSDEEYGNYYEVLNENVNRYIVRDDRLNVLRRMDPSAILNKLSKQKDYFVRFRVKNNRDWFELHIVNQDEELSDSSVIMGLRNINQIVEEEEQREEEKRKLENARQLGLIASLTEDFDIVSVLDADNGFAEEHYKVVPKMEKEMDMLLSLPDFESRLKLFGEKYVIPEDRVKYDRETSLDNVLNQLKPRKAVYCNYRVDFDGDVRYYQVKFTGNYENDKLKQIIVGFHDIDSEMREELEREAMLAKAKESAERGNEAKTTFLFNMSHDIRTPMNAILGFTNMAIKNIDDKEKVLDSLTKAKDSSNVLLGLINQILDMSRIEAGYISLVDDKMDMDEFGKNILPMLNELASSKNIDLKFSVGEISDRYVIYDSLRVDEILVNIVSNAIKYTHSGGYVDVRVEQVSSNVNGYSEYSFVVEDNGIGMSEEFQKEVFEQFTREETSTVSGVQGTGLGLPLCKKLVELMNGTIEVESEQSVGSKFTVILPFKLRDKDDEVEEIDEEYLNIDFAGKKILLVEDNELNREIASELLLEEGFDVDFAEDGRRAIENVEKKGYNYYDFILMDIQMPFMNGYEATKIIRGMSTKRHIPIIALSANAFSEDKEKSLQVGMDDHVAKPIVMDELLKTLARFV